MLTRCELVRDMVQFGDVLTATSVPDHCYEKALLMIFMEISGGLCQEKELLPD